MPTEPGRRAWGRPRARAGEGLYAFRIPGGRREVQSGERAGVGELLMPLYVGLAPKKARCKGAAEKVLEDVHSQLQAS